MPKRFSSQSLAEWLTYLEGMHAKTVDLGLDRMRPVAQQIWPHNPCPVVTVAGTNGKGTTVASLQALAAHAGWRVGVYTSPHLFHFNERIVLDLPGSGAQPVSDTQLIEAFEEIDALRGDVTLTYFEFTTLAALSIFSSMQLDLVILEVGLGGRLDSTNVVDADIAIITRIALDHMDYLGDTREQIAVEKAGIMRPGKPCIYGGEDLLGVIQDCATKHGAVLYSVSTLLDDPILQQVSQNTLIPLANLACAFTAFQLLGGQSSASQWTQLSAKKPKGRFTPIYWQGKTVIFDVAHNPDAMALLAQHIAHLPQTDVRMVIGMLADKDHAASVQPLKHDPRIRFYVSSPSGTPRAAPAVSLMNALDGKNAKQFNTLLEAFHASLEDATPDSVWIVAGSFYTVAELWDVLTSQ